MTWEEKGKLKLQLNFMAEPLRTVLTEKDITPSPPPVAIHRQHSRNTLMEPRSTRSGGIDGETRVAKR